ncbi:MAG: GH3 auxin-responsive promoter family protein [Planctomycetes bacterium]|nr:GH3 auxin-responsive promoter family protein [Planctomycetota bacterium]
MSLLHPLAKTLARHRLARLRGRANDPRPVQDKTLRGLIRTASGTSFGREHAFRSLHSHAEFQRAVPLRDYHGLAPWWERARRGEPSVSWPGFIRHWAISSGTTSGEKFLPVSDATIRTNKQGGFDTLVPFLAEESVDLFAGKMLFLGGSTALRREGPSWVGDNTGIMTRHIPAFMRRYHSPGQAIAGIGEWERKIEATVQLALDQDVRMLSGVPSWLTLFGERVLETARALGRRADCLRDVWPHLSLIVHGGMAFAPYRARLMELVGTEIRCIDTYSASEGGMLAVQDRRTEIDMLPLLDQGTFFEFVPVSEVGGETPTRLAIHEVELDVDYAVALSTDSGIWGYLVGDIVRFTSRSPYRLVFAGRLAHTMNAFGEHLSGGEIDRALLTAAQATGHAVREYAVAAVYPGEGNPVGGHCYYVEFEGGRTPDLETFARVIDETLQRGNEDYTSHRSGGYGLIAPVVRPLAHDAFYDWMKARGKYGGQNKVPRVLNPELEADFLKFLETAASAS